jgi:magnesium chelatase subunit I
VYTEEIIMWFDAGGALQVADDIEAGAVVRGFGTVPGLVDAVELTALAEPDDAPVLAAACELLLESLVARKKISRTDAGLYGRSHEEKRRRPYQD